MMSNAKQRMTRQLRHCGFIFAILVALSFGTSFISTWQGSFGFLLLGALIWLGAIIIGGGVCLFLGIKAALPNGAWVDRTIVVLTAPTLLGLAVLLASPVFAAGEFCGTWARLMMNRGQYAAIIARETERTGAPVSVSYKKYGGITYVVDSGPPIHVAFDPAGILDNWTGIIYDPTGEVMLAKVFDPVTGVFQMPSHIKKFFGGDLVTCSHIRGDYYKCSFT